MRLLRCLRVAKRSKGENIIAQILVELFIGDEPEDRPSRADTLATGERSALGEEETGDVEVRGFVVGSVHEGLWERMPPC
jgi:hypothetical protein